MKIAYFSLLQVGVWAYCYMMKVKLVAIGAPR